MAEKEPGILFLYGVPGTGHQKAAKALRHALSRVAPEIETAEASLQDSSFHFWASRVNSAYLTLLNRAPSGWNYLYDRSWLRFMDKPLRHGAGLMGQSLFKNDYRHKLGKVVVATQAAAANVAAEAKRRGAFKGRLIGVITDFSVHRYWVHPEIDAYVAPHADAKEELVRQGVPAEKIFVFGIPINGLNSAERTQQVLPFSLDPSRPLILIMGGGRGLFSPRHLLEAISQLRKKTQCVFLCGENGRLYNFLNRIDGLGEARVHAVKTPDAGPWMKKADLLISKPGGMTSAEALAFHVPWIIWKPLPGQEERNAKFLARHEAARWARSESDLAGLLPFLLEDQEERRKLQTKMRSLSRPWAAEEGARFLANLMGMAKESNQEVRN